jgi:16S rRNA (cytidine1402-2'-O)-methyltransferase
LKKGTLYLIPIHLGGTETDRIAIPQVVDVATTLRHFVVENVRTSRRYLSQLKHPDISSCEFSELNKHTDPADLAGFISPLLNGIDMGVMSEAGCPGVADPGADVVRIAHEKGIPVAPLVGANSILLTLMASGMNGQAFTFHGYLAKERNDRINKLRKIEQAARNGSQVFMETPFRNNHLLDDVLAVCKPGTKLCIGSMLTTDDEFVVTKNVSEWKKRKPDLHKKPTIFIIGT